MHKLVNAVLFSVAVVVCAIAVLSSVPWDASAQGGEVEGRASAREGRPAPVRSPPWMRASPAPQAHSPPC